MQNHEQSEDTSEYLPVLATGQDSCRDEHGKPIECPTSGQDAESRPGLAWPEPRFETHNETALDRLTGLTWAVGAEAATFPLPWPEAFDAIDTMNAENYGGRSDWRLPGRRELHSLVSFAAKKPALPAGHPFGSVFLGWYWTRTTFAGSAEHAWRVHMEGGRMFYGRKSEDSLIWPVAGESAVLPASGRRQLFEAKGRDTVHGLPLPEPRFTPEPDSKSEIGVVRDNLTGLVWARRADLCGPVTWTEALAKVAELNTADPARTWALPTIRELESLTDASRTFPALAQGHPFSNVGEAYWSSTSSSYEYDWAMNLYLHKGAVGVGYKTGEPFLVWPVSRGA